MGKPDKMSPAVIQASEIIEHNSIAPGIKGRDRNKVCEECGFKAKHHFMPPKPYRKAPCNNVTLTK